MFYLLTGTLPFKHSEVANLLLFCGGASSDETFKTSQEQAETMVRYLSTGDPNAVNINVASNNIAIKRKKVPKGFERMMDISNEHDISSEALSIITGLLTIEESKRLGSGVNGPRQLRHHSFFQNIKWTLLSQKLIKPPIIPLLPSETETPLYESFEEMIKKIHHEWLSEAPSNDEQIYFSTWYYLFIYFIMLS